mgnify:CR=1 FL=1
MRHMDDLAKAQADAEQALDEALALQAQQQPGDVSIELVVAMAKVADAMEALALAQRAGSLRIKPSSFDQQADQASTAWAAPEWPRNSPSSLH